MLTLKESRVIRTWRLPAIILLTGLLVLGVAACGKKGPLYLEDSQNKSQQETK